MSTRFFYATVIPFLVFGYWRTTPVSGLPCFHNNQTYQQGDKWRLNCKQTCSCQGGADPVVYCYDHCLQWYMLPPDCQLTPPAPGKCCAEPVCPEHVKLNIPKGYTPPDCPVKCREEYIKEAESKKSGPACVYNNRTYAKGETWVENCQQTCTCEGGPMGFVRCRDLCIQWDNLPSVCQLKPPAPGKCCPEPSCPAYMLFQYPPGYTEPECPPECQSRVQIDKTTSVVGSTGTSPKSCTSDNIVYAPGVTWFSKDCQQRCTCDGSTGYPHCQNICLQWPTLPPVCQMKPPELGKCCPEPSCPPYIHISYPSGYVPPECPTVCNSTYTSNYRQIADVRKTNNMNFCIYGNRTYQEGDTWIENCEQLCKCDNGTTGYVSCHDLCLHWYTLPPACTLRAPEPGKCCPEPSCPAIYQIQHPPGYSPPDCPVACRSKIMSKYNMVMQPTMMNMDYCLYKNKTYARGETWIENCKQRCICEAGPTAFIKCQDLCLTWTQLPAACHMKPPAPGKCCPEPSCPPYIKLQYPQGYRSPDCPASCSLNQLTQ